MKYKDRIQMKCLGHLWAFIGKKSKVQIRPHSIKSVRLVLKGLSALRLLTIQHATWYGLMHCQCQACLQNKTT